MKLYKISQDINSGYDTYDSAVVCSKNENDARNTHFPSSDYTWTIPENVKVELIGTADKEIKEGIIVSSFNAG